MGQDQLVQVQPDQPRGEKPGPLLLGRAGLFLNLI